MFTTLSGTTWCSCPMIHPCPIGGIPISNKHRRLLLTARLGKDEWLLPYFPIEYNWLSRRHLQWLFFWTAVVVHVWVITSYSFVIDVISYPHQEGPFMENSLILFSRRCRFGWFVLIIEWPGDNAMSAAISHVIRRPPLCWGLIGGGVAGNIAWTVGRLKSPDWTNWLLRSRWPMAARIFYCSKYLEGKFISIS